jgi:hypothetical protein
MRITCYVNPIKNAPENHIDKASIVGTKVVYGGKCFHLNQLAL